MLSARPISRNAEGASYHSYTQKTPGRALQNRGENAFRPATVHAKGKHAVLQTPMQSNALQPKSLFKDATQLKTAPRLVTRPLGDKTPFPNRSNAQIQPFQTPYVDTHYGGTPDSALRPSSLRTHIKVPRGSLGKNFETPMNNNGRHWDVSDIEISVPESPTKVEVQEDDFDEVEYGPPNTLDLPYQPPFDFELPDYKAVGRTIMDFARNYPHDEDDAPAEIEMDAEQIHCLTWDMLSLAEIPDDDNPFRTVSSPPAKLPSATATTLRGTASSRSVRPVTQVNKPTPIPKSFSTTIPTRTQSAASTATTPAFRTAVPSKLSRPATSASTTGPSQVNRTLTATAGLAIRRPVVKSGQAAVTKTRSVPVAKPSIAPTRTMAVKSIAGVRSAATTTATPGVSAVGAAQRRPATSTSVYARPGATKGVTAPTRSAPGPRPGAPISSRVKPAEVDSGLILGVGEDLIGGPGEDFMFDI